MKKLFNHTKREQNYEEWDDLDFEDDVQYEDEAAYEDEDGVLYEEDVQYADEEYTDEEAYEDEVEYADDVVYEDEAEYADDVVYEDEVEYADDVAYEDEMEYSEEDGYYGEDGVFYVYEYADEEPEDDVEYMEDDVAYEEDYGYEAKENIFVKLWTTFLHMGTVDRIVASTGVIVLILALVTGTVYASSRIVDKQVSSFATVGNQLDGIALPGGDGLMAIADAEKAKQQVAGAMEEIYNVETGEYEEKEYSKEVTVALNTTSIKQDLKIKFVNKKTNKLIPNVPFEVSVTDPKGKTTTWTDDDKDGIIYKKDIKSGDYKIAVNPLSGYADYTLPSDTVKTKVKEKIDYEKVDVTDEIKTEAEIDASKEDTALNGTEQESKLTDTVAWVESTKSNVGESFAEVGKNTIPDPSTLARAFEFVKLSQTGGTVSPGDPVNPPVDPPVVTEPTASISGGGSCAANGSVSLSASTNLSNANYTWNITSNGVGYTKSGDGASTTLTFANTDFTSKTVQVSVTVVGQLDGAEKSKTSETINITVEGVQDATTLTLPTTETVAVQGTKQLTATLTTNRTDKALTWSSADMSIVTVDTNGNITGVKAGTAKVTATHTASGKTAECSVTVVAAAITLKPTTETVLERATKQIAVEGNTSNLAITWKSSDTKIATVTGDNGKATITGVKKGTATITATFAGGEATCVVTVKPDPTTDRSTALKDAKGNQIYVKNASGQYVAATYADYYVANQKFYTKQQAVRYTGWQTLDGKVYFFDANGNKVTGAQVIQGAQYSFDSNGVMVSSNGVLGIDVSKWNGSIDWKAVKNSGVSYVIIRCGYRGSSAGSLVEDPKYRTNIQGATAAGLKVGVYFFTQAVNEVEAVEEASMVLSLVKNYKISYPIFLDVESSGGRADGINTATRTAVCKAFCQTIQNSGYTAGIYANKTWFTTKIDASALGAYKIWLAQYAAKPSYSGRYEIWQYSSKGRISGISTDVDMNLSYLGY